MPYAQRRIHDADAHFMETPDWFHAFADPDVRDKLPPVFIASVKPGEERMIDAFSARHRDPAYRAEDEKQIMLRKNWAATGSFLKEDRPLALDLLGFESQLVFNTFANGKLLAAERGDDVGYCYGFARAHNRSMLDFCAVDRRLLATGYVPLRDFSRSRAMAGEVIETGCNALLVPSGCPRGHSPSHTALDPVWAQAQEAGLPIVFHVGGGQRLADGKLLDMDYFENGGPRVPDFHGGDENFRSVDYMAIPTAPMQTLATLIFDGVLERFPRLKLGVIEQGASWIRAGCASWIRPSTRFASAKIACRSCLSCRASSSGGRSARHPTPPRTSAGSREMPVPRSASSPRTTLTSKAGATPSSASKRACWS